MLRGAQHDNVDFDGSFSSGRENIEQNAQNGFQPPPRKLTRILLDKQSELMYYTHRLINHLVKYNVSTDQLRI